MRGAEEEGVGKLEAGEDLEAACLFVPSFADKRP